MVRCKKCGRKVKYPVWVNGSAYGSTCAKSVQPDMLKVEKLSKEVGYLRSLVLQLQKQLQSKQDVWAPLPIVPGNGSEHPIDLGYGENHLKMMDELKSVLKGRTIN